MRIDFHIGAHRTGTLSLQEALREVNSELANEGIIAKTPTELRIDVTPHIQKAFRHYDESSQIELVKYFDTLWKTHADAKQIILSEENISGNMLSAFKANGLYKAIAYRVGGLDALTPIPARFHLSLRNYADFYRSIYAYNFGHNFVLNFDAIRETLLQTTRGWYEIALDLLSVLPASQLNLIAYESYAKDISQLHQQLGIQTTVKIPNLQTHRTPSAKAMSAIQSEIKNGEPLMRKECNAIIADIDTSETEKYDPWRESEHEQLDDQYRTDIARIQTELGIPIRFDPNWRTQT